MRVCKDPGGPGTGRECCPRRARPRPAGGSAKAAQYRIRRRGDGPPRVPHREYLGPWYPAVAHPCHVPPRAIWQDTGHAGAHPPPAGVSFRSWGVPGGCLRANSWFPVQGRAAQSRLGVRVLRGVLHKHARCAVRRIPCVFGGAVCRSGPPPALAGGAAGPARRYHMSPHAPTGAPRGRQKCYGPAFGEFLKPRVMHPTALACRSPGTPWMGHARPAGHRGSPQHVISMPDPSDLSVRRPSPYPWPALRRPLRTGRIGDPAGIAAPPAMRYGAIPAARPRRSAPYGDTISACPGMCRKGAPSHLLHGSLCLYTSAQHSMTNGKKNNSRSPVVPCSGGRRSDDDN